MNAQSLVEIGGFLVMVAGLVYNYAYQRGKSELLELAMNAKIDQHIKDDHTAFLTINNQIQRQWEWKDTHEKDGVEKRFENQKQMAELKAGIQNHDGHYNEILRVINSMSVDVAAKFDRLEKSIEQIRKN